MKLKSHKGTKKRIRVTGTGKLRFQKPGKQHLLVNKSKKAKQRGRAAHGVAVDATHADRMTRLLPYS